MMLFLELLLGLSDGGGFALISPHPVATTAPTTQNRLGAFTTVCSNYFQLCSNPHAYHSPLLANL
jgi:hypothetical protein